MATSVPCARSRVNQAVSERTVVRYTGVRRPAGVTVTLACAVALTAGPGEAAPAPEFVLVGTSSRTTTVVLRTPVTLRLSGDIGTYGTFEGTHAGLMIKGGSLRQPSGVVLVRGIKASYWEMGLPFGEASEGELDLEPGSYSFSLLADGPAELRVPYKGRFPVKRLTPGKRIVVHSAHRESRGTPVLDLRLPITTTPRSTSFVAIMQEYSTPGFGSGHDSCIAAPGARCTSATAHTVNRGVHPPMIVPGSVPGSHWVTSWNSQHGNQNPRGDYDAVFTMLGAGGPPYEHVAFAMAVE